MDVLKKVDLWFLLIFTQKNKNKNKTPTMEIHYDLRESTIWHYK